MRLRSSEDDQQLTTKPSSGDIVLANTVYFKAYWQTIFNSGDQKDFYLLNGNTVPVPFMSLHLVGMYYGHFDGFTILKLPYRMGKDVNMFSMHIFLPDERDGLPKLVEKMGSEFLIQHF
ncbi:hypothetical protein Droror1_Dr00007419 [Drosera rotundifolia]